MKSDKDQTVLIEAAASAFRARGADGSIRASPAWFDLDVEGRCKVVEVSRQMRMIEAAADPDGLSSTAKAVLAIITENSSPSTSF